MLVLDPRDGSTKDDLQVGTSRDGNSTDSHGTSPVDLPTFSVEILWFSCRYNMPDSSHGNPMMGIRGILPRWFRWRMRSQRCLMFTGGELWSPWAFFFTTYIRQDDDPPSGRLVICNGRGCVVWFKIEGAQFGSELGKHIQWYTKSNFPYWWWFILGTNHVFFSFWLRLFEHDTSNFIDAYLNLFRINDTKNIKKYQKMNWWRSSLHPPLQLRQMTYPSYYPLVNPGAFSSIPEPSALYVPGSKLPLFPYNRGWSSTQ